MHILPHTINPFSIATIDLYTIKIDERAKNKHPPQQPSRLHRKTVNGSPRQLRKVSSSSLREQDEKIYTRRKRFAYGKGITVFALSIIPVAYLAYVTFQ